MNQYFNEKLYSDFNPFELIEVVSPKKVKIRKMNAVRVDVPVYDNNNQIVNNHEIRYEFSSDEDGYEITVTKRKDGNWYQLGRKSGNNEVKYLNESKPYKYYDYGF